MDVKSLSSFSFKTALCLNRNAKDNLRPSVKNIFLVFVLIYSSLPDKMLKSFRVKSAVKIHKNENRKLTAALVISCLKVLNESVSVKNTHLVKCFETGAFLNVSGSFPRPKI